MGWEFGLPNLNCGIVSSLIEQLGPERRRDHRNAKAASRDPVTVAPWLSCVMTTVNMWCEENRDQN